MGTEDIGQTGPSTDLSTADQPAGTTRVDNGVAYDISGKPLGQASVSQAPAEQPQKIDYAALAKQAGAIGSEQTAPQPEQKIDYAALAKQAGAVGSEATPQQPKKSLWENIKSAVAGPGTALGTPLNEAQESEASGLSDILHGDFAEGGKKIWNAEKIDASKIAPGSPVEWTIRQFDPDFHGTAQTDKYAGGLITGAKTHNEAVENPLIDVAQFIDKDKHPIGKALTEVAQGFTSPENIAIMYGTGGLGLIGKTPQAMKAFGVMNKLISAGFAYQALEGAYQHSAAFKKAFDNGDLSDAEYQLTHAVLSGTIGLQAATHAAEGAPLPGYDKSGKGNTVKPLVELSPTEQKVASAIGSAVNHAVNVSTNFAKDAAQATADRVGSALGKTSNFNEAVTRAANMMGKKAGPEFREKVESVSDDLKDIINNDKDGNIKDPKSAAEAINQHIQTNIEAPLLKEAHATKDSVEPVVPNFQARLAERLDQFFDENAGKFGSPEEESAIKQRILDRMNRDGRDPNLYEAENIRQGLNKSAGDVFEHGTSNGYRAASAEAANFMREVIDEAYQAKGVKGVPEARQAEANLIDIRDALNAAQGKFESQQSMPAVLKLFKTSTTAGILGGLAAHFLSGPLGAIAGAGELWRNTYRENAGDIGANLERAKGLAGRDQAAQASTPEFGTAPNRPAGYQNPAGPEEPPSTAPGLPPAPKPPTPPEPVKAPLVNHRLNGALSSFFGEFKDAVPYDQLLQKFLDHSDKLRKLIDSGASADTPVTGPDGIRRTLQEQLKLTAGMRAKLNAEKAMEDEQVEKQNKANEAKYQKELQKYQKDKAKHEADVAKIQQEAAEEEAKNKKTTALQNAGPTTPHTEGTLEINPVLDAQGRGNESALVAHGSAMKAHSPADESFSSLHPGISPEDVHREEWSHIAMGALDGLNPEEIRSESHPSMKDSDAVAAAVFDADNLYDPEGNIDPEALEHQLVQWVTQKMAGPASHEVFGGQTREFAEKGPSRRDVLQAKAMVREVHPDWNESQVNAYVTEGYNRARDFLSKPHVNSRIRANASVRETGLSPTLHASPSRVMNFVDDLRGAHDEYTGNASGNGSELEKGGEKESRAEEERTGGDSTEKAQNEGRDEGGRGEESRGGNGTNKDARGGVEELSQSSKSRKAETMQPYDESKLPHSQPVRVTFDDGTTHEDAVRGLNKGHALYRAQQNWPNAKIEPIEKSPRPNPKAGLKETTTGDEKADAAIREAGAIPAGIMGDKEGMHVKMFHDPKTESTLGLMGDQEVTPEAVREKLLESRKKYVASGELKPEDLEQSHSEKSRNQFEDAVSHYGLTDDIHKAGFVGPDGRMLDFSDGQKARTLDHGDIATITKSTDPRNDFIHNTGAARFVYSPKQNYLGIHYSFEHPLTSAQLEQFEPLLKEGTKVELEAVSQNPDTRGLSGVVGGHMGEAGDLNELKQVANRAQVNAEEKAASRRETQQLGVSHSTKATPEDQTQRELQDAARSINPNYNGAHVQPDIRESEIADAYKNAVHEPNNPKVKASYDALKRDIDKQYDLLKSMGFDMGTAEENPYGLSTEVPAHEELHNDVLRNKHLDVWKGGAPPADHPLSEVDPKTGLTYNDKFRMVHDIFGHAAEKTDFTPAGEESAWNLHRQLFSPEARPALATETRGQAAYTYKYGDFPPQKATILPEHLQVRPEDLKEKDWAHNVASNLEKAPAGGINPNNPDAPSERYGFELMPEVRKPLESAPTADDFRNYAEQEDVKKALAQHPDIKLGWDTTGQKPELNIGVTTNDLDKAKDMAGKLDQRDLWDNEEGKTVPAGGTGEKTEFPEYPLDERLRDLGISNAVKGSSVPLMKKPLEVKGTGKEGKISTLDVAKALNAYSQKQHPALELGEAEPEEEQSSFNFGHNELPEALAGKKPYPTKHAGAIHAFDFINALKGTK